MQKTEVGTEARGLKQMKQSKRKQINIFTGSASSNGRCTLRGRRARPGGRREHTRGGALISGGVLRIFAMVRGSIADVRAVIIRLNIVRGVRTLAGVGGVRGDR